MEKDGQVIEPVEVGYPPREKKFRFITATESAHKTLVHHKDNKNNDEDCKEYIPNGEVYIRPAGSTHLVAAASSGGTEGSEITISKSRTVSQSVTCSAGLNFGVISASTEISFEESLEDTKEKKWNITAWQTSKVGFTPTLKCTTGTLKCNKDSSGEACTGFKEAGEIAGTYDVISTS